MLVFTLKFNYVCSMKSMKRFLGILALALVLVVGVSCLTAQAQCAMCTLTAENATQNGNTQGDGLNNGILFLLAMPYIAVAAVALLWYKKFRAKQTVKVEDKPIVLN